METILKKTRFILEEGLNSLLNQKYILLSERYKAFNHSVKKNRKSFDMFILESINSLENYTYTSDTSQFDLINKANTHAYLVSLFMLRPDLISKYFHREDFNHMDAKQMQYEFDNTVFNPQESINISKDPIKTEETFLEKCVKQAIYYNSRHGYIHMAIRIGGYLFKAKYLNARDKKEKIQIWEKYIGHIGEPVFLGNPSHVKGSKKISIERLEELLIFFKDKDETITGYIENDIQSIRDKKCK